MLPDNNEARRRIANTSKLYYPYIATATTKNRLNCELSFNHRDKALVFCSSTKRACAFCFNTDHLTTILVPKILMNLEFLTKIHIKWQHLRLCWEHEIYLLSIRPLVSNDPEMVELRGESPPNELSSPKSNDGINVPEQLLVATEDIMEEIPH